MLLEAITAKLIEFRDDIIKLSERLLKTEQALQAEALERNSLLIALQSFESVKTDAQKTVEELVIGAESKIQLAIEAIPVPKDGEDADPVDYDAIYERVDGKINTALSDFEALANSEFKGIKSDLKTDLVKSIDGVARTLEERISKIPPAKNGEDGVVDYSLVDTKIKQAIGEIKQPDSPIVVSDISLKNRDLTVFYTDGSKKTILLPTPKGGGSTTVYQNGGGGTETYTNLTPTAVSIGGIPAGSTFDNMTMQEMWDALLYPYQTPAFSSFTSSMSTPIEVGSTIPAGSVTFLWNTTNSSNIAANSIKIDDITAGNTLASGLANTGTTAISISEITNVMATSHQWKITATNTKGVFLSRTLNVYWQWKIYYGESALTDLTETDVEALRVGTLAANVSGNYSFNAGEYKWICYPTSFGLKTTFKDASTNFDVAMQPALTKSITNSQGVSTNYYCHRTVNKLGGSITISIS